MGARDELDVVDFVELSHHVAAEEIAYKSEDRKEVREIASTSVILSEQVVHPLIIIFSTTQFAPFILVYG